MSTQQFSQSVQEAVEQFKQLDEKISHYTSILGLLGWDLRTGAPKKGVPIFAKAKGALSTDTFKLSVSEEMGKCLDVLTKPEVYEQLDEVTKACIRERKNSYDKQKSIPPEMYKEYVILQSNSVAAWEKARANNDFATFQPFLDKMVQFKKEFVKLQGHTTGHPYDALLDDFEPGLTVKKLDPLFADLRKSSIDLLQRIQASTNKPRKEIFEQKYDVQTQKEFNRFLLPKIGYDLEAGRLDEAAHPFAMPINTGDVRITTRYMEDNVRSAIFGTIHEAGHALYEQGVNPEFEGTVIRRGASFGIHESQSRFLENVVGRSEEFWTHFYQDLQEYFPEQLKTVPLEDFCRAINDVAPSLIRVEADELTYNLHIMIRYEIEKALMEDKIEVKDLPQVWNDKMQEYLGVTPPSDALGVLQDIHWSQGGFGYFPSYSLGNLYAAQILKTIEKELPNFYTDISKGEFTSIREWLREHVHQYGKLYTPTELIVRITGEELDAKYLVEYLEQKYTKVYGL